MVSTMEEEIVRIAKKLGENPKLMRKNLVKAEAFAVAVDNIPQNLDSSFYSTSRGDSFVFGRPLECLTTIPTVINYNDRFYPINVPTIAYDLGQKLMENSGVTGIGRIPPNAKRMEKTMEAIDSGATVRKLPGLHVHDLGGLLKQWTRMLPSPILPDFVSIYFLLICEKISLRKMSEMEAYAQLLFFAKYIPLRYKELLAYLSYVLWNISQKSDLNGMTAKNLAICCPHLFIGSFAQRLVSAHQLQSLIYLMEFFISNPHILLSDDKAAVLKENKEEVFRLTLSKPVMDPFFTFPPVSSNSHAFPASRTGIRHSNVQGRGVPFKALNSLAMDIKNRIREGLGIACLKPVEDDTVEEASSSPKMRFVSPEMCSPITAPALDATLDMPDNIYALITPPRDQFRAKRHSSTRASVISRRSYDDLDLHENFSGDMVFGPFALDFDHDAEDWCSPQRSYVSTASRTFSADSFVTANEDVFENEYRQQRSNVSVRR
ncbi:uncharacterized protein LOC129598015 [Paramacrobiotus metropolitanus]|uniref:uncharacterized protein LOC129598015 n=1 Tax=Paramacrobiotus metropolitanus TaxID=2943436 RepID=UPI002445CB72|nr:uncharacterized protein LOC129598015 [Paramacrobiotus metropolitanus]